MLIIKVSSSIIRYKKGRRHDYDIYKKNHPVIPKVLNVFDLGYLEVEKDFHEQKSYIPNRKKKNQELLQEVIEHNKNHSRERDNSDRTCHLQIEKV